MSWKISQAVWQLDLPYAEKIVLLALAEYADDSGLGWPSVSTLARMSGCDQRTCRRKLGELRARGIVELIRESQGRRSTRTYRIHHTKGDSLPPQGHGYRRSEANKGDSVTGGQPVRGGGTESPGWGDNVPPEPVSESVTESVSTNSSPGNGQSELLTDPPTPTLQAVSHFLQTFSLKWTLKGSTLRSWCHDLDSDPKYASLDIPRLVRECEEHHDSIGTKNLDPTKRIKYWLNGAAPGGRFASPPDEEPTVSGFYR